MANPVSEYDRIAELFVARNDDIQLGKMMSSPGLKCRGKVFSFHCKDGMGFRLGPQFDMAASGVSKPKPLSPFKTKPPLKGWYIVAESESDKWEYLTATALEFTRTLAP